MEKQPSLLFYPKYTLLALLHLKVPRDLVPLIQLSGDRNRVWREPGRGRCSREVAMTKPSYLHMRFLSELYPGDVSWGLPAGNHVSCIFASARLLHDKGAAVTIPCLATECSHASRERWPDLVPFNLFSVKTYLEEYWPIVSCQLVFTGCLSHGCVTFSCQMRSMCKGAQGHSPVPITMGNVQHEMWVFWKQKHTPLIITRSLEA